MDRVTEAGRVGSRRRRVEDPKTRWNSRSARGELLIAAATLFLLVVVAGGYQMVYAGSVFPGVQVGDVKLGGMSRERALAELGPVYEERSHRPLLVRGPEVQWQVSAADLGATFDASAAVAAAYEVGRTGGLIERLTAQMGALARGHAVDTPGVAVDRTRLQRYLATLAQSVDRPVQDARLVVGDTLDVRVTPAVTGRRVDQTAAAAALEKAFANGTAALDLPVVETKPKTVEGDLREAQTRVSAMVSGPVSLEFQGRRWNVAAQEIAGMISVETKDGGPVPVVGLQDGPLRSLIDRIAGEVDQPKTDARLDWNGGQIKRLTPGQDGRKLDRTKTLSLLTEAISGKGRVVALPVEVDRAIGDSRVDPAGLGIKERIDYGQTTVAGVPEKVHNIKLAAERLNGVVVRPGDTFSFNRELGPTTLKSGYQIGFGIAVNNGEMQTVPSVAGGICQVATTLLHAIFWAGYQLEERYAHLYWIQSYGQPPRGLTGLDATVDDPTLDLKFINNTADYLLIQSRTSNGILQFDLYGTRPTWKVDVQGPIITNVVKADQATVRQEEPTWDEGRELWVERATDGMDVEIIRRVTQGGDVRTLDLKSRYQPSQNVLMVGTRKTQPVAPATPATAATPAPSATAVAPAQPRPGLPGATPAATPRPAAPVATPAPAGQPAASPGTAAPAAPPAAPAPAGTPRTQ